jgi:hypothetical protein
MLALGAFAFLLASVFGSYLVSGGSIEVLAEALPFEMWTIGGSAAASFVMANSMHDLKHSMANFKKIFAGAAFSKSDYVDLLSLLYFLVRLASTKGNMALEPHIENPADSSAFQKFPKVLANRFASAMICDYLRMVGMNADDPNQIEDFMARELKKTLNEELHGAHALQTMADALPAARDRRGSAWRDQDDVAYRPASRGSWCDDRQRTVRNLPRGAAGLWSGGTICEPAQERDRGRGEVLRGDPCRPGHASAWKCAAGQRGVRTQDGAE